MARAATRASTKTALKVFLFTDLVDATAMKRRVGDTAGAAAIAEHDELFRACLAEYGGVESTHTGDGFFATFDVPSDALRCALAFQQQLGALDAAEPLHARAGIHMGEIVRIANDHSTSGAEKLVGLAIDTAARVMGLARSGQILLTRHAFDSVRQQVAAADDGAALEWRAHGPYRFKGIDDPIEIFEAGLLGLSPLEPPEDTPNARRSVAPGDDETLGWRPAIDHKVPGREKWALERQIGLGGFGEVWLARHKSTRDVRAFKFCFHADRLRSLKRELTLFRLMKESLGERPDIARLFEVQLDEPPYYLEMEYTPGGNLCDWADTHGGIKHVPLERRLELAAQVADALAAAHSVGVIHKDVKPANVLIHEPNVGGVQARLTDFGIGELVSSDRLAAAGITATGFGGTQEMPLSELGSLSGTQLYMAPELLAGKPPSTRSDIYALGVLLYELCIADLHRPLAHGWERGVDDALLREDIAACIAGDPQLRLSSADQLATRLRTLDRRRAEREQQIRREEQEMRRKRLLRLVSGAAVASVFVAVVLCVAWFQAENARRRAVSAEQAETAQRTIAEAAQARAESEAARANAVTDFLERTLSSVDPEVDGRDVLVVDVLRRAALEIDTSFADRPLAEAALRGIIGVTYRHLGHYELAEPHLSKSLEIFRRHKSADSDETLDAIADLALLRKRQGRYDEAETLCLEALAAAERRYGERHASTLRFVNNLAGVLHELGRAAEALAMLRETLEIRLRTLDADDAEVLTNRNNLATMLQAEGRPAEAEVIFREVLEALRRRYGNDHLETLVTESNLGQVVYDQARWDEAEQHYRHVLEIRRRELGDEHPDTLAGMNHMAGVLREQKRFAEAEPLFRETLRVQARVLGEKHPNTLMTMNNLGGALRAQSKFEEAETIYRDVLSKLRGVFDRDHPMLFGAMNNLAALLSDADKPDEAEPLYREALEMLRRLAGASHPTTLLVMNNLASLLQDAGRDEAAVAMYEELFAAAGERRPDDNWQLVLFRSNYGACLTKLKRFEEAERLLPAAYETLKRLRGARDHWTLNALGKTAKLYDAWDKPEKAGEYRALLAPTDTQPTSEPSDEAESSSESGDGCAAAPANEVVMRICRRFVSPTDEDGWPTSSEVGNANRPPIRVPHG